MSIQQVPGPILYKILYLAISSSENAIQTFSSISLTCTIFKKQLNNIEKLKICLTFQHAAKQWEFLKKFPQLKELSLSQQTEIPCLGIDDKSLGHISINHPHLEKIELPGCRFFSSNRITSFINSFAHQLKMLNFVGCYQIEDTAFADLLDLPKLKELMLPSSITDEGLKHIADKCRALEILNIDNTHITDLGITYLKKFCPHLKSISAKNCPNISKL